MKILEGKNIKGSFRDAFEKSKASISQTINGFKEKKQEKLVKRAQSDEMLDLSTKLKLHKNKVRLRTVAICMTIFILVVGYSIYHHVRVFRGYSVISSTERSDDNATKYIALKKGCTLKCNPNGVTCVNGSNDVQWNTTFTMQNPIVDVCGTTVAVADQNASDIYIFNTKGLIGNFTVEHVLTKIKVTKQGVVAAVLEDGEVTWINVYDSQGNILVKTKTSMKETGYPLDLDISEDGLKMMVSYLSINNNNVESRVVFYNFSSLGQDKADNIVSQMDYEGEIIPEVKFMDDNYAAAFRDDGVSIFRGRQVPEEKNDIQVEEEIVSAFSSDKYFGIVTESDEEELEHKYKMQVYRINGTKCFTAYFDTEFSDVQIYNDEILLYNNSEIRTYSTSGKLVFDATYEKQIVEVMPLGGNRKYIIITPDSTDEIKIR